MENDDDTPQGGDSLTIEQAAAAYSKSKAEAVRKDDAGAQEATESDASTDDELQSDEPAEGESLEADAIEGDDAAGAEGEPETDQGRFVADNAKVRLADGTVTTIGELKRGNLREGDYTRKTQEAAAVKKAVEDQSSAIKQRETELNQQAEYLSALVQSIVPPVPDPSMMQTDPMGYLQQKEAREQWLAHLNYLQGNQTKAKADADAKSQADRKARADEEWAKVLEKVPDFKDAAKTKAFVESSLKWAEANGYPQKEFAEQLMMSHANVITVRKAMAWDRLQASKAAAAKKTEGKPPVITGGNRLGPGIAQSRRATELRSIAQKSGRLEDVVAAFSASRPK